MNFILKLCRIAIVFTAGLGSASAVFAGDFAAIDMLGFSADGQTFAFEQYGVQDGSGFPYSEIFLIDVATDRWISPSPFRRQGEDVEQPGQTEASYLARIRSENRQTAQPYLDQTGIAGQGRVVGHNPATEISADPEHMVVTPRLIVPSADDPLELELTEFPLPSSECASFGAETKGFRLTFRYQGDVKVLNDDTALPKSRGCPLRYRIERIMTHYPDNAPPVFAILILMETHGFEGPDGRYLAITGTF